MSQTYTAAGKRRSSQTHARRGRKCDFCEAVPRGNGGKVAHARKHAREGVAVELEKHWPYPTSPSRLFLPAEDAGRIARFVEDGYLIVEPTGLGAVVECSNGERWVRAAPASRWPWFNPDYARRHWGQLGSAVVLHEGYTPEGGAE